MARTRGYAVGLDSYIQRMAAIAVPVFASGDPRPIGCLSITLPRSASPPTGRRR